MTKLRHFGILVILLILITLSLAVIIKNFSHSSVTVTTTVTEVTIPTTRYEVIDSVWYLSPGQLNTSQLDYIYYAKTTSGFMFRTNRLMEVGDTINISNE